MDRFEVEGKLIELLTPYLCHTDPSRQVRPEDLNAALYELRLTLGANPLLRHDLEPEDRVQVARNDRTGAEVSPLNLL